MVNWYKNLYVGDTAKKKQKKWMRRIENKKAVPGVWLLTLPSNQQNNLDVIPADLLLQPCRARKLLSLWRRSHWKLIGKPEK